MSKPTVYRAKPHPSLRHFIYVLRQRGVTAIADCRSQTEPRAFPAYRPHALKAYLERNGIAYAYVGAELGGKPPAKGLYDDNGALKPRSLVRTRAYQSGVKRLLEGVKKHVIAVLDYDNTTVRDACLTSTLKTKGIDYAPIVSSAMPAAA